MGINSIDLIDWEGRTEGRKTVEVKHFQHDWDWNDPALGKGRAAIKFRWWQRVPPVVAARPVNGMLGPIARQFWVPTLWLDMRKYWSARVS